MRRPKRSKFQSTLPRRERRHRAFLLRISSNYFNPRSRGGSDAMVLRLSHRQFQFQSTLPRRERRLEGTRRERQLKISIHAPAEGATFFLSYINFLKSDFNPRSRGGSDIIKYKGGRYMDNFNPRSRGGSDTYNHAKKSKGKYFNPRSRGGSDAVRKRSRRRC